MKNDNIKLMIRLIIRDFDESKEKKIERNLQNSLKQLNIRGKLELYLIEQERKHPDATGCIFAVYTGQALSVEDFTKAFDVCWFYETSQSYLSGDPDKIGTEDEDATWSQNDHPHQVFIIPEITWAHVYSWDARERRQKELEKKWNEGVDYESIKLKDPGNVKFLIRLVMEEFDKGLTYKITNNVNQKLASLNSNAKIEFVSSEPYWIKPPVNTIMLSVSSRKDITLKDFVELFKDVTWYYQMHQSFNTRDPDKIVFDVEDAEWSKTLSQDKEEFLFPEIIWVHCYSWDWERRREEVLVKKSMS